VTGPQLERRLRIAMSALIETPPELQLRIFLVSNKTGSRIAWVQHSFISDIPECPVDTLMSAPKQPPQVCQVHVPPLTSTTEGATPYKRRADVEASIARALKQPSSEWVTLAKARGEHHLCDEALAFLVRAARHDDRNVLGSLVDELSRRTSCIAKTFSGGFDPGTTEAIVQKVEIGILESIFAKVPSRQSEFLEIAFKQAVKRRTIKVVATFKQEAMSRVFDVIHSTENESEAEDCQQEFRDERPGPEEIVLSREEAALEPEQIRAARRAVKDARHWEAVVLHYVHGWPLTSTDPQKPCLKRHFGISERQIHNWITQALDSMRSAIGAKR